MVVSDILFLSTLLGEMIQFDYYFSDGLKPTTSYTVYSDRFAGVFAAKDFRSTSYTTETVDTPANLTRNSVDMLFKYSIPCFTGYL